MYCENYDNIYSNAMLQIYLLRSNKYSKVIELLQTPFHSVVKNKDEIPQTLKDISAVTGLPELDIIRAIENVGMQLLHKDMTVVTIVTTTDIFTETFKKEFGLKSIGDSSADRVVNSLINTYVARDFNNNTLPEPDTNYFNLLGWTYDRFKMVIGGVGNQDLELQKSNIKQMILNIQDTITSEGIEDTNKKADLKLPLIEFFRLCKSFNGCCSTISNNIYKDLLDVLIVLDYNKSQAQSGKPYIDLNTIDHTSRSAIETMLCCKPNPLSKEKGIAKKAIQFVYDSNLIDSTGKEGVGLKIQSYFSIVNRIRNTHYTTIIEFIADISNFSNDIRESYFRPEAGNSDSLTHVVGASNIKPVDDDTIEELTNMNLDCMIISTYKKNTANDLFEKTPSILTNQGLQMMIELSAAPYIIDTMEKGLRDMGKSWYDLISLRDEYNNLAANLKPRNETLQKQYKELRFIKEPDTSAVNYIASNKAMSIQIPIGDIERVLLLCNFVNNPCNDTYELLTHKYHPSLDVIPAEVIQEHMCKLYHDAYQVNLLMKIEDISDIIKRMEQYYLMFKEPKYGPYNLMFVIAYDSSTQELMNLLSSLAEFTLKSSVPHERESVVAYTTLTTAISNCTVNFEPLLEISKYYGIDFTYSELEAGLELAVTQKDLQNSLKMLRSLQADEPKALDSRYLIGEDTFYRSKGTGKLIITRISSTEVSVLNSITGFVKFRKEEDKWLRSL